MLQLSPLPWVLYLCPLYLLLYLLQSTITALVVDCCRHVDDLVQQATVSGYTLPMYIYGGMALGITIGAYFNGASVSTLLILGLVTVCLHLLALD